VEVSSQRPGGARRVEPLLLALSLLTLVTGLVDAACYLGLGRVFTANMTGNVVLLGFGAAKAQGLPVLAPTVSLVVFLAGAAAGGRLATGMVGPAGTQAAAPVRRRWVTVALQAELGLVAGAGWWRSGCRSAVAAPAGTWSSACWPPGWGCRTPPSAAWRSPM
jgi:uncharacterized membrane protein YoaK (UPF0700 family)